MPVTPNPLVYTFSLRITAPAPVAAARARQALREADLGLPEEAEREVELLMSEVVKNAVLHGSRGHSAIEVRLRTTRGTVEVEVEDEGPGFRWNNPSVTPLTPGGLGLGLVLVEQLAARWGIERRHGHTIVWFSVAMRRHSRSARHATPPSAAGLGRPRLRLASQSV